MSSPACSPRTPRGVPVSVSARAEHRQLVAGALAVQTLLVAWVAGARPAALAIMLAGAAAALFAWEWRGRVPHLDAVVATCAFGGLGMALALAWRGPAAHAHHAMHAGAVFAPDLRALGAMLAVCVPACLWTCSPVCGGSRARRALAHLGVTAGMVGGMMAGALLAPVFAAVAGPPAGMHLAMVLGMSAGTAAALPAVTLLDRAPRGHDPTPTRPEAAWQG